jgi:hypothetical protein
MMINGLTPITLLRGVSIRRSTVTPGYQVAGSGLFQSLGKLVNTQLRRRFTIGVEVDEEFGDSYDT